MKEKFDLQKLLNAANGGDKKAMKALVKYYLAADNDEKQDEVEATYWLKKWEETGDVEAKFTLGLMYCTGKYCVVKDFLHGINLIRKAAKEGYDDAIYYINDFEKDIRKSGFDNLDDYLLNTYHRIPIDVCDNKSTIEPLLKENDENLTALEKRKLLKVKADEGDADAQGELAQLLMSLGDDYFDESYVYAQKAAKQNNLKGIYALGLCYEHGRGTRKNYKKAKEIYKKGADMGDMYTQCNYGNLCLDNQGGKADYAEGFKYSLKAAEQGYAIAMNNLAFIYEEGLGVERDFKKALEWYEKAGKTLNDAAFQNRVALCYFNEDESGEIYNLKRALYWYKKAADNGDETCGKCYNFWSFVYKYAKENGMGYSESFEYIAQHDMLNEAESYLGVSDISDIDFDENSDEDNNEDNDEDFN